MTLPVGRELIKPTYLDGLATTVNMPIWRFMRSRVGWTVRAEVVTGDVTVRTHHEVLWGQRTYRGYLTPLSEQAHCNNK